MKSNVLRLSTLAVAIAALVALPAGAATGTAFIPNPAIGVDQPPRPIDQIEPFYSPYLRHAVIEGQVVVAYTVTARGDVADATIVSSTHRLLNKPTLDAIMKWRFAPALKAGVPVTSKVQQVVSYSIPDAPR